MIFDDLDGFEAVVPKIKVIGVGGAGGNAVDRMIENDVQGVEFITVNTDAQDLKASLADKRLLIGRKRVVVGYFLNSITPDMYNDLKVSSGILWGKVYIDTIKEFVTLSNISKAALREIETQISSYMMEAKKQYKDKEEKDYEEEA